jgi:glycosyltransferase involved in cell wall biosynthesis
LRRSQPKVTLFIPAKNEVIGAQLIMPRIKKEWVDEIIVIDGNSNDGTFEYFSENGYKVYRQKSDGICGAYWEALEHATGDIIIAFSPDNNSVPELIPDLVAKMRQGYDMVIVSRYLNGAKSEDDDIVTAFGNWMFTKLVNVLFRSNYTDTLVMFRAFRADLVQRMQLDEKELPVFEMQLCVRCAKLNGKVTEIPGDEPKRIGGKRKMRPIYNGAANLWCITKELFRFGPREQIKVTNEN